MRSELVDLLVESGIADARGLAWDAIIVTRGNGSLVHPSRPVDRNLSDRGFHFVIAGAAGGPAYYAKARPALGAPSRHRETVVLEALAADARSRRFVPPVWSAVNARIDLQITGFVRGEPLDRYLRKHDRGERDAMLVEVLDAAASLSTAALARPDVFAAAASTPLVQLAREALDAFPALGVAPAVAERVRDVLEQAGPAPEVPQHGDYWPQNVLRTDAGSWCVIDLDNFGDVVVPVYDVAHMLRTFDDVSGGERTPWIGRLPSPTCAATRAHLRRELERWRLTPAQLGACVLIYLADIAMRVWKRGAPEVFWGRFRDEVPAAAAAIERCGSLDAFGRSLTEP